ncbi:MAG: CrcB family protein [Elusimicrobiota bacterium]|nr:CrcB family protein [Elusimicrobiota bacterium]
MISEIGALLAGGTAGVLARWLVTGWLPWGTVAVNLSGCFLMGVFDAAASRRGFGGPNGRTMLLAGFCGAYTTFSALIFELDTLLRTSPLKGGAYLVVSVAAGLALFRAGAMLVAR